MRSMGKKGKKYLPWTPLMMGELKGVHAMSIDNIIAAPQPAQSIATQILPLRGILWFSSGFFIAKRNKHMVNNITTR